MANNFIQEQLSWAYVRAVIFNAGYGLSLPIVDDHGIDGTVEAPGRGLNKMDFSLKPQLYTTSRMIIFVTTYALRTTTN